MDRKLNEEEIAPQERPEVVEVKRREQEKREIKQRSKKERGAMR